jgi:replicative DNA helicase
MALGKLFVAALLAEGSPTDLIKHGPLEHLFKAHELDVYQFVKNFVGQYHTMPKPETVLAHTGEELPEPKEPLSYYLDLLKLRYIELELKSAMKQAADKLGTDDKDPEAALKIIADAVMGLMIQKHRQLVVDFRDAYDLVVGEYLQQWTKDDDAGINLGWPTLDNNTGGLMPGDMVSLVGRPEKGKTMQMLYAARTPWQAGNRVLFVSMEMKPLAIHQRLSALHATIPMTKLKTGNLTTKARDKLKTVLTEVKGAKAPLWVVDGNFTATVEDIWVMSRQLKPDVIFVDGGYLLKHPTERDRFKRVAENADLIKQQLSDLAPVVCSWQFSRDAAKKKLKGKLAHQQQQAGLEDIGYTDAIGQVSSVVLALFEEESVETVGQRRIEIIKGRNGEKGRFRTRWDWIRMRFDELVDESVADLKFV